MNKNAAITGLTVLGLLVAVVLLTSACYIVNEREQVVVTRFNRPVRVIVGDRAADIEVIRTEIANLKMGRVSVSSGPGLYFKMPFVDTPERLPDTLIEYDSDPEHIVTRDKKQLALDNFAWWRIENPLLFRLRVQNIWTAQDRLENIIYSIMREEVGKSDLIEIIRTTKEFTDFTEAAEAEEIDAESQAVMRERLSRGREEIMALVTERVNEMVRAQQLGIRVIDVRIKRAELLPQNLQAVFARMRAERERISKGYVSEGDRQASVIQGETDRDVRIMIAEAEEQAQKLRGEGDAESVRIIAEAFNSNPEFYTYVRSLEVIGDATPQGAEFVVGLDSSLYRMIAQPQ